MKHLQTIHAKVLLLFCFSIALHFPGVHGGTPLLLTIHSAHAQWDTAGIRLSELKVAPAAVGTGLMAAGSAFTFVPTVNNLQVALRDNIVQSSMPKIHVDDYLQYTTAVAPLALNICGLKSRHTTGRLALLEGGSYLLGAGWLNAFKYGIGVLRPDNSRYNSFPSGHTFVAFTGAEILRREYGKEYPWIAVAGYAAAVIVGAMRVYNNRHWAGDVLAGAGLGIASVTLVYWALD